MADNSMRALLDAIAQQLHDEGPDEFHGSETTSCRFCAPEHDAPEVDPPEQCGWNPVQANTDCDFDKNCPVHGSQEHPHA